MTTVRLSRTLGAPDLRVRAAWATRWMAFWVAVIFTAAAFGVIASAGSPEILLAPVALCIGAIVVRLAPVPTLVALLFISGAGGSLFAFFGFPVTTVQTALVGALIAGAIAAKLFLGRPEPMRLWPGALLLLGLVVVSLSWIVLSPSPNSALQAWRGGWLFIAAAVAVAYVPMRARHDRPFVVAALGVALLLAGYAILRWIIGSADQELAAFIQSAGKYAVLDGSTDRVIGAIGDAHALSSWMTAFVPFSLAIAIGTKRWIRVLAIATLSACLVVIIGSEVRSALAATAVGCLLVLGLAAASTSLGSRRFIAVSLAAMTAATGAASVALVSPDDSRLVDRFSAILDPGSDGAFQERRYKWNTALRQIGDEPVGNGLGTGGTKAFQFSRFASAGTTGTDSSYLKMAFEQGVIFTLLFVLTLLVLLSGLVRHAILAKDRWSATIATGAAGTLIAFGLHLNFEMLYIEVPASLASWMLIGIGMRQVLRR